MDNKLKQADIALKKAANYVAATQPILDEYNEFRDQFTKRAHQTIGTLIARGVLPKARSGMALDKLASDPLYMFDIVDTLAEHISPPTMGSRTEIKTASSEYDAFELLALTGSPHGRTAQLGSID